MSARGYTEIPDEVWARWMKPEFDKLKHAVLVFGGNVRQEAAIALFEDVALDISKGEEASLRGVLYLTTRRIVFLPRNMIPHENIVQASYESLRGLSGMRSSISITLVDGDGATANFHFPSSQSLFRCFNLMRLFAEGVRMPEERFRSVAVRQAVTQAFDDTPFSALEIELPECRHSAGIGSAPQDVGEDVKEDPLVSVLAPMKDFFDYCISLNFDIHFKLRFLLVLSLVSFFLKYMPFFPFVQLCVALTLLATAWHGMNQERIRREKDTEIPEVAVGFVNSQRFVSDWLIWRNPSKSFALLEISVANFIAWLILPTKWYFLVTVISFGVLIFRYMGKSDITRQIIPCFLFST